MVSAQGLLLLPAPGLGLRSLEEIAPGQVGDLGTRCDSVSEVLAFSGAQSCVRRGYDAFSFLPPNTRREVEV